MTSSTLLYTGIAFCTFLSYRLYRFLTQQPTNLPHGVPVVPHWDILKSFYSGEPTVNRLKRLFGPHELKRGLVCAKIQTGQWTVFVARPDWARVILLQTDVFPKYLRSEFTDPGKQHMLMVRFFGGSNVVFSNGDVWKRHRRVVNPVFHHTWSTNVFGKIALELFDEMDKSISKGENVEMHDGMQRFTLDALGRAIMDYDFGASRNEFSKAIENYNDILRGLSDFKYFFFPWLERVPVGKRRQLHKKVDEMDELFMDIINKRREDISVKKMQPGWADKTDKDLLTLMLEASEGDAENPTLSARELRDNLAIFFIAGHDTTANALSFTLYFLAIHLDVQEKARAEIDRIFGTHNKSTPTIPTHDQIKEMRYIMMIIKESMRIYPPVVGIVSRVSTESVTLPGSSYTFPPGTYFGVDTFGMHHNPDIYPNPEEFNPERWSEDADGKIDKFAWLPFGSGSRICLGMNFSLVEQRVLLAMLLQKYTWRLPPGASSEIKFRTAGGLLGPSDLWLEFKKREVS